MLVKVNSIVFIYALLSISKAQAWKAIFSPTKIEVNMNTVAIGNLSIIGVDKDKSYKFVIKSHNNNIVTVNKSIHSTEIGTNGEWWGEFDINGKFLGNTELFVELVKMDDSTEESENKMNIIVIREIRIIDHIFTGSVALLVSLLNINFGAAVDLKVIKGILIKPIGPVIGFIGQFLLMPLISFILGYLLFPNMYELQLGLFFTGVSPGGGASNIWTVILHGNINLSIMMTTISTFAAFGMMPLWIFTLGKVIFDRANLGVPYSKIATFAFALIIPLGIGLAIQKYFPRFAQLLVRLLKPISIILILFIVCFAIVTNLYLFQLFSWQILIAGLGLPFFGYTLSFIFAKLMRQCPPDITAISLETGIQNTGIAIFLLRFSLNQPEADLTTVVPVAVAIMTPVPLLFLYIYYKLRSRSKLSDDDVIVKSVSSELS